MYGAIEVAEREAADSPPVGLGTTAAPSEGEPWVSVAPFGAEVRLPEIPPLGMPVITAVSEGTGAPVGRPAVFSVAAFEAEVVQ